MSEKLQVDVILCFIFFQDNSDKARYQLLNELLYFNEDGNIVEVQNNRTLNQDDLIAFIDSVYGSKGNNVSCLLI